MFISKLRNVAAILALAFATVAYSQPPPPPVVVVVAGPRKCGAREEHCSCDHLRRRSVKLVMSPARDRWARGIMFLR